MSSMSYSLDEVELMLTLYPIAKIHLNEIETTEQLNTGKGLAKHEKYSKDYYAFIICIVNYWLNSLFPDEIEILKLRIFKKMTFDYISIQLGYSNHSSTVRKYRNILKKISQLEIECDG